MFICFDVSLKKKKIEMNYNDISLFIFWCYFKCFVWGVLCSYNYQLNDD